MEDGDNDDDDRHRTLLLLLLLLLPHLVDDEAVILGPHTDPIPLKNIHHVLIGIDCMAQ